MNANMKVVFFFFFTQSVKQQLFSLFHLISLKINIRMINLNCFNTIQNLTLIS